MNKTVVNDDIRKAIKMSGFKQWKVAERYGLSEGNFCRLLRRELPTEKKEKIFSILGAVKEEDREGMQL